MEIQNASEVVKIQAEKNQLKKIIEGLNSQLKNISDELEGTKKRLKKAEYERDSAQSYVTNLKQEIATLNKELHVERQKRKEELQSKIVSSKELHFSEPTQISTSHEQGNQDLKSALAEAASAAMTKSGFVFDERTGLYYDWNSGLYYNPRTCLYYNNNTGTYYTYNESSRSYDFHSQVDIQAIANTAQESVEKQKRRKEKKIKGLAIQDDDDDDDNDDDNDGYSSGEITDSESDTNVIGDDAAADGDAVSDNEMPQTVVAPCIRMIVTSSSKLKTGTLFIVPCTGGHLGREKDSSNLVRIPDLEVSKHHCRIQYDQERRQYFIQDLGSRNGSFLNDARLSQSKDTSELHVLTHGDRLSVGGTRLLLHIHPGMETCDECEPGQVQALDMTSANQVIQMANTSDARKKQLKLLKKAYGLDKDAFCEPGDVMNKKKYKDRADIRRVKVGSDAPNQPDAIPSSVHRPINADNKGRKLLEKMGWKTGEGLGKEKSGRVEPVMASVRENKRGLGGGVKRSLDEAHLSSYSGSFLRAKTRERFKKIAVSTVTNGISDKKEISIGKDVDMFAE